MIELIKVTDKAAHHIKKTMAQHAGAVAFRLSVKQTGCSGYMYMPEVVTAPKAGDLVAYQQHDLLVYLAPEALDMLKGTTIDFASKAFGMEQLVYHNPNTDSLCGCGESFTLKVSPHD